MKRMVLITFVLMLLMSSTVVIAETENLSSLNDAIKSNTNISGVFKGEGKNVLIGMSKSFFDIARYSAISYVIIRLFMLGMEFESAADSPEIKAKLKTKAMWHTLGLLFGLNFWSVTSFLMDIANKLNFL